MSEYVERLQKSYLDWEMKIDSSEAKIRELKRQLLIEEANLLNLRYYAASAKLELQRAKLLEVGRNGESSE